MGAQSCCQEPLWYYDLPHIGILCQRIRERRHLHQRDIVELTGLSASTVTRVEKNRTSLDSFTQYIQAFLHGSPPLSQQQIDALRLLYLNSQPAKIADLQAELAVIDFRDIRSGNRPPQLDDLLTELRNEQRPAFIRDNLWFIHAYNGAIMHMFGVDFQHKKNLQHWTAWHLLGTKFVADSPIRQAHCEPANYFRNVVDGFWHDLHRYLFTWQVRILIYRLYTLAHRDGLDFEYIWSAAATSTLEYQLSHYTRTLRRPGTYDQLFRVQSSEPMSINPEVVYKSKYWTGYTLVVWNPIDEAAKEFFSEIQRDAYSREILFAADYDCERTFHVNSWPEVSGVLDI